MKPPGTKRLSVVASLALYVVCLGLPVWWRTTSLNRPALPHAEMQGAPGSTQSSVVLPISVHVVLALAPGTPHSSPSAADMLQALQAAVKRAHVSLAASVVTGPGACSHAPPGPDWACPELGAAPADAASSTHAQKEAVDAWLAQRSPISQPAAAGPGRYTLFLLPAASAPAGGATAVSIGRRRSAWAAYQPGATPQQLLALAGGAAADAVRCCFGLRSSAKAVARAEALPVSAGGATQLSFSLLNAQPGAGSTWAWAFGAFESGYLAPLVASLAPVARVSIESQVLHFTPARSQGTWSARHGAFVVKDSQLPFLIDSEWAVESGRAVMAAAATGAAQQAAAAPRGAPPAAAAATAAAAANASAAAARAAGAAGGLEPHVLHLLVYLPAPSHSPLLLLGPKGRRRDSNSFWLPSWGGLQVLNTGGESAAGGNSSSSSSSGGAAGQPRFPAQQLRWLQPEHYRQIAAVVIAQLQALFGVAPHRASERVQLLPAGLAGFAAWQVDALVRQRVASDVSEAARVLASLSKLVQELPNLEMPDVIGTQVGEALSALAAARAAIAGGDYAAAGASAAAARAAAEAAFSNPAVLAQLNFPESHKLGVYMPLFLPAAVPLLQGLAAQLRHWGRRRREWRSWLLEQQRRAQEHRGEGEKAE